jgi:MFS family permease
MERRRRQQHQHGGITGNTSDGTGIMNSNVNDFFPDDNSSNSSIAVRENDEAGSITSSPTTITTPASQAQQLSQDTTNVKPIIAALLGSLTTGGTTYAFSVYSAELKSSLHLSQSELDTISASFFCAGLFSWMPGMLSDRFGPKFGMMFGSISMMASLLVYYWVATRFSAASHAIIVPTLSAVGVWTFLSCAAVTGAVFKLISVNCDPRTGNKGVAVGTAKGYVGLGSGAYECLFASFKQLLMVGVGGYVVSDLEFLPMAAIFAILAACVPAMCLLDGRTGGAMKFTIQDVLQPWHFRIVYGGLLGLGIIVVGTSLLSLEENAATHHNNNSGNSTSNQSDTNDERWLDESSELDIGTDLSSTLPSGIVSNAGDSFNQVVVAVLVLAFWFIPILSLLCVVDRKHRPNFGQHALVRDDDDEDDVEDDVEQVTFGQDHNKDHTSAMTGVESAVALMTNGEVSSSKAGDDDNKQEEGTQLLNDGNGDAQSVTSSNAPLSSPPMLPQQQPNLTLRQMLSTLPAWLMLWTCTILAGGGTMMTNNLGQMAESLGLDPSTAPAALALFSAAQATGRVVTGSMSESALHSSYRTPRPLFLTLASCATLLSHLLLAVATSEHWFVIGVTLSGFSFGMIWPLMVLIVGEFFGTAHMGANYMFYDGATSALGTLLLSKFVTQTVYERHIHDANGLDSSSSEEPVGQEDADNDVTASATELYASSELTCYGKDCFAASHWTVVALSVTCIISSVAMWRTTRHVYQNQ